MWTGNGASGSGTTTNANYANAAANTTIAAGVPNITGWFAANDAAADGTLFTSEAYQTWPYGSSAGGGRPKLTFNASRSNSVYGTSSTVQPPAYVVNVWRRTA